MHRGDTFLITEPGTSLDDHLWVVVSYPEVDSANVVCLNITTYADYKDRSCVLAEGDHPWIKHDSCIYYDGPKVVQHETLGTFQEQGLITLHESMPDNTLIRIYEGATITNRMPLECKNILDKQGLIIL